MENSFIHLFIYEVKGPLNNDKEYSFNPLILKKNNNNNNNNNNSFIIPKEIINNKNNSKIFTIDIIKNRKNSINNNFYNLIKKNKNKKNFLSLFLFNYSNKKLSYDFNILYELYKKYSARLSIEKLQLLNKNPISIKIKKNIYLKIKNLLEINTIIFKKYLEDNLKINSNIKKLQNSSDIIYNIDSNKKIIVIGDIHGSFHSFFRIILRFYIQGIIKNDYMLDENYQIIFLGDVIDRGNYSMEVLYIILRLIKKNNINNNLSIILIRGNHEETDTYKYYGFKKEINLKTPKMNDNFVNFFKYCPSAIILNNNGTRYWLCHGGFQISNNYKKYNEKIVINNNNPLSQIRWNDFSGNDKTKCSDRNECLNYLKIIGNKDLFEFLNQLQINFIIRGHNDNYSNAMLLKENNIDENYIDEKFFFFLNNVENKNIINNSINNSIIKYKIPHKKSKKCLNEILTIYPKNFEKKSFTINSDIKLLPVLTISNNSDLDRTQYSDSYIIISNDKDFIK